MPKKSIRDMNIWERRHNSLSARTFHSILMMALIIGLAAVLFGYYLYSTSISRQYRLETWHLSRSEAQLLDMDAVRAKSETILSVYDSIPEEEKGDGTSEEYQARFDSVRDEQFEQMRTAMHQLQEDNELIAAYVAAIDPVKNRMIFIIDSDPRDSFCPPGYWDDLTEKQTKDLLQGTEATAIDKLLGEKESMTAIVSHWEKYGYRCTAGTKLFDIGDYSVMAFMDSDMNEVARISLKFLLQYLLLILLLTLLVAYLMVRHMKRTVVKPINELASAAYAYTQDKRNEHRTGRHFEALDIHTGDEIENLSLTMKDMERDLAEYVQDLTAVTAEKERINTELDIAGKIQESMIPHIFPAYPERKEFDVYASMEPAKEVGGDFYDFFLIDEDHLGLVMADVSGKGVPAALFMMASKILINNFSMMDKVSPAKVLSSVNEQICSNNTAEMFVTVWLGILELSTGKLKAANAGHEFPVIRRANGPYEIYKDPHALVVGVLPETEYIDYELTLAPGDSVFQYTDGIPEARNSRGEMFGIERLLSALNRNPDANPQEVLDQAAREVREFTGEANPFDDITMLCLQYRGPQAEEKGNDHE